jgi:RNA polymerase sigma factor (TIGR02999 family)
MRDGDGALELDPALYQELRAIAHRQLRGERRDHVVCTTVLANDAYLKLAGQGEARISDRAHFLAVAATAMRRILVDYARARLADKRGGRDVVVTFEDAVGGGAATAGELIALDEVLARLEAVSERQARVVVYRVFGGLGEEECAEVLGVSVPTIRRDWRFARAWLVRELAGAGGVLGRVE